MLINRLVTALVIAAASTASAVGAVPAAWATPTENYRDSGSDSFTTSKVCSDPIRVDSTWSIVIHTFYDAAGTATRLAFTGTTRISYTDLANGNTYAPNSSGPGTINLSTGQTWVRGSNAAVFSNDGVLMSTSGRIIYSADGSIISITGKQRSVCAALGTGDYGG